MSTYPEAIPPHPPLRVNPPPTTFHDPASHSFPGIHFTDHLHLDLRISFSTQTIHSTATYTLRNLDPTATHLTLDAVGLDITSITSPALSEPISYTLEKPTSRIGAALRIALPEPLRSAPTLSLSISYSTGGKGDGHPAGGALDWLSAAQTATSTPFAFTQCQAIHARSLLPCQDTPAVKATYSALVSVEAPYEALQVVMSAQRVATREGDRPGAVRFECGVPVPSYLIAFAIGSLEFRSISHRCAVWAEPHVVEKAAWEFAEVETMLQIAEKVAGEYVWGRYDLLVLPGSFPYGGMENPFLTFVTPTLLAGDRSLVSVVAHEIAHSWSGNLVSCRDCRHFWVNEGFTVKLERKILRDMYGPGREGLDAVAGRQALESFVKSVGNDHKYTSLVSKLKDEEDPDDYFSCVAYEKGYNLLLWLEHLVKQGGHGDFHEFLREYFRKYRYQSITGEDFIGLFREQFPSTAEGVAFEQWLNGVGLCPNLAPVDTSLVQEAATLARKWLAAFAETKTTSEQEALKVIKERTGADKDGFGSWDSKQILCFLTEMKAQIDKAKAAGEEIVWNARCAQYLQVMYSLGSVRNSEIRFVWCRLALMAEYPDILDNVKDFVSTQGRMKFIRPLYNDLANVYPKGNYSKELFSESKSGYHSIASKMIERDLSTG